MAMSDPGATNEERRTVADRRQLTARVEALLAINERSGKPSEREFLTFGLELAERLTQSRMGFLHFVNDDQETLEFVTWTERSLHDCTVAHDSHYPISQAGLWANCVHSRRPMVCNDYAAAEGPKGCPPGQVEMFRLVSVPVLEGDKVRMILGVGNKDGDYESFDIETLQLIGNSLWRIAHGERVEQALARSVEKLRTIFNAISEGIFLHDERGTTVDFNDAALNMYGYSREELVASTIDQLSENASPYTLVDAMALMKRARAGEPQTFEWHARRRDGELFWVEVRSRMVPLGERMLLLSTVTDITERKRYREAREAHMRDLAALNAKLEDAHLQLLQSEKMASIGQLAAGVAHEINNPVGYVFSNIGSLEKYVIDFTAMLDAYEKAESALDATSRETLVRLRGELEIGYLKQDVVALLAESREGLNRVRKIVQDLKDFSRVGAEDEWQWADLHACLDSTLNIVWNELKYKTTVNKEYGDLPKVYCLPSQLNQVFMNLMMNAAHAIDTKGVVTLRSGCENDAVWVEVADTGCGIPAENLKRIFDPFFTTKPVGKGTGLGLSVSYSIVQKHQGKIEVTSELGKGSVFRVWLPVQPTVVQDKAD